MEPPPFYDVIITGGGAAGCATALSIIRSDPDISILLLDDADSNHFKIGESLPAEAKRILAYLSPELPPRLSQDTSNGVHIGCTGNASAWTTPEVEESYAIMNPFGMGLHLDRTAFDEVLRSTVRNVLKDPCAVSKAVFTGVEKGADSWFVSAEELSSRRLIIYRSKWVIDATGRKASLAHKLGAKTTKTDSLLAFYALFEASPTNEDFDHRTFIEASESGWWYTSLLANNRRIVVYHTDDTDPSSKCARKQEGFLQLLDTNTAHVSRLIVEGEYDIVADPKARQPKCVAAGSSYLEPCFVIQDGLGWCAVGDAAMAFDPLSSQGMITALKMGCFVGGALVQQLYPKSGNGDREGLGSIPDIYAQVRLKYEREKQYYYDQVTRLEGEFWRKRRLLQ